MTTGAIAYDDISRSAPQLVDEVDHIMQFHPDRKRFEKNLAGLAGKARQRELFKWMARWPDDIRDTPYDRPTWHYALRVVSPWSSIIRGEYGDARQAFASNLAIARDNRVAAGRRAVSLCWLFHIIGDMQQPLHAGHWASLAFPLTDRGGSRLFVRRAEQAPRIQLHQYWDFAIDIRAQDSVAADNHARRIESLFPRRALTELAAHEMPAASFSRWADESARLSFLGVYRDEVRSATGMFAKDAVISRRYAAFASALASRRVADGGYRIADTLRIVLKTPSSASPP